jgi:pimeloyl-ACP methyl ester carboxylesterase
MMALSSVRSGVAQVVLPGGIRLNYLHGGPRDGVAVLMLHGIADSSFSFSRVLPFIPSNVRYVVPDQRGHGESDRPFGYAMDDFANDALHLMAALDIEEAVLVGHSMGSFVARRIAERMPDRVLKLVLVGTALSPQNLVLADTLVAFESLTDPISEAFVREFQLSTIARPVPRPFMARVVQESLKVPARVWRDAMAGIWAYRQQWPLTCPTLILGGEDDALFSRDEQTALFLATERSALHLEPGVGHTLHWEAPERFAELAFRDL